MPIRKIKRVLEGTSHTKKSPTFVFDEVFLEEIQSVSFV